MAIGGRNGIRGRGTHREEPLNVAQGPLEDVSRGFVDNYLSPYKVWVEDFKERFADAQLATVGWQVDDIGTPTAPSEVNAGGVALADRSMLLNPGTAADTGTQIQFKIPSTAASLTSTHNVLPEITSTTTLFDNQEIFFQTRVGHISATAATSNNKWLIGIFTDDDSLISATTNLPTVAAGGGFGFYKSEVGPVTGVSTEAAITAVGTAMVPAVDHVALATDAVAEWHTYAARCRMIDASAGTGRCDFWVDGRHRLALTTVPFDSTELYSFAIAIANGPTTVVVSDMLVDYIITGITRPGLTWPYTDGTIY